MMNSVSKLTHEEHICLPKLPLLLQLRKSSNEWLDDTEPQSTVKLSFLGVANDNGGGLQLLDVVDDLSLLLLSKVILLISTVGEFIGGVNGVLGNWSVTISPAEEISTDSSVNVFDPMLLDSYAMVDFVRGDFLSFLLDFGLFLIFRKKLMILSLSL